MIIERLSIDLPRLPDIAPQDFAQSLARHLHAMAPQTPLRIATLHLPVITAQRGDTADSLARRTAQAIVSALPGGPP